MNYLLSYIIGAHFVTAFVACAQMSEEDYQDKYSQIILLFYVVTDCITAGVAAYLLLKQGN